ncbi:hypothetical protein [Rickettsia prowazekii]|uniref:Uncharacterized protein n=1 Tax=Rickettsia prowazekii (strain Rp22) TaxID=449216 RepID=D5AXT4_RICPP|nr:hypothetical protein [Rickettsia prowazekii]ADE30223.1 conserved hypothetical protein [Rickettsia prowazekii str. Rp22]AFE49475.1 hypothetical protein M9W_03250 [Rickettsia prowazekii str. Chernikova]AFE50319.1 hypothetical protein M9Y_03255 [Rickettsia prowazekii str. Katsinyian]AFE51165.1 hypothetical protein MA1_03245 [Rickettsia prowazekii str. BuV67-CWPP]AFE52001.1 hypothetical protein MA3_03290 [Rickettsia prowazekii str. Dachau]
MSGKLIKFYEKYMTIVGTIGNFMFYIQANKIWAYTSSYSVSIPTFNISVIAFCNWLIYNILIINTPIIIDVVIRELILLLTIIIY